MSEITTNERIAKINALTTEQRDRAYESARKRIVGAEPTLAAFLKTEIVKYSRTTTTVITVLCVLMLTATFIPSAIRIHAAALIAFANSMTDIHSIYWGAICTVVMAEIGQIIFSLASATMTQRMYRIAFWVGAIVCTLIALAGNYEIAWHGQQSQSAFAFLETFAPPVLTLITAQVLKSQFLASDKRKQEAQLAFTQTHNAWTVSLANAEQSQQWERTLALCVWDAIRDANKRSPAAIRELTDADRRALVARERKATEWWGEAQTQGANASAHTPLLQTPTTQHRNAFVAPQADTVSQSQESEEETQPVHAPQTQARHVVGKVSGTATGEYANANVEIDENGMFIRTCPICGFRTQPNATQRGASASLSAHSKAHRNANATQGGER